MSSNLVLHEICNGCRSLMMVFDLKVEPDIRGVDSSRRCLC